jgi:hypothetical protein
MSNEGETFLELCKQKFRFLIDEYGFVLKSSRRESGNIFKVVYQSKTASVHINWEFRDNLIYVNLYRLVDGKLLKDPITISKDTVVNSFDLDILLLLREPTAMPKTNSIPRNLDDVEKIVDRYSLLLSKYASDVLRGDFTVLKDIEVLIKEKALDQSDISFSDGH